MVKFVAWSFGVAVALAGLALGSAALLAQSDDRPAYVEPLAWLFFVGTLVFLGMAILVGTAWVVRSIWRYFHTVNIREGGWFSRYWPHERVAEVHGVLVEIGHWAGEVEVSCQMEFADCEQPYIAQVNTWGGLQTIQFPPKPVSLTAEPKEGDRVAITVMAKPAWWRGRASHRTVESRIGITGHRPNRPNTSEARTDEAAAETPAPAPEEQ